MKKYFVRVKSTQQGGLQSVLLFDPISVIEFLGYKEDDEGGVEEYEITTRFDLDRVLDTSSEVISYISEEV